MSQKSTPFLLTGVTGGLGAKILEDMLHVHHVPPQDILATSRSEKNQDRFEAQGLQFRVADYKRPDTLEAAFKGVENLLFMSSSERDNDIRMSEHVNFIEAAKKARCSQFTIVGVSKVWYISLAFGGYASTSKIGFQQAHYKTEYLLQQSGLDFVSIRAGVYSDAFPLFLNWYPSTKSVLLPSVQPPVEQSRIALTSRDELGEGIATLLAKGLQTFPHIVPHTEKNIVLLTAGETNSLTDLVGAIQRGQERDLSFEILPPEQWIEESAKDDRGGKGKAWFEARLVFTRGVCDGDAAVMDSALQTLLGRKPETGVQTVERLVREAIQKGGEGYFWHQNHISGQGL